MAEGKKEDGRRNNGGHSTKGFAGRKPKAVEQEMVEKLTPLSDKAYRKLEEGIDAGNFRFIQLYFNYFLGKPKETQTITITEDPPIFNLSEEEAED